MKFFSIFKKNNNSVYEKEKVEADSDNGIPSLHVIKMDGSRYVDISKISSDEEKLVFIRNNTELLNNGYRGFVIQKKVKSKTYVNDHSYNKNAFLLNGLVIISELGESIFHGTVVIEMNRIILNYLNTYPGYINGTGTSDIIINENTVYNPDGSFEIFPPQFPTRVLLVFEVNYKSKSKIEAFNKCRSYFGNNSINIVILLQLYSLGVGQSKKICAVVFDRSFGIVDPSAIISFGSQTITARDINKYRNLSNNTPITGSLHNNNSVNNAPNNPIYTITIQPNSLFFQNPPFPNIPPPLIIDLFTVKQKIDLIPLQYLN
ncbi:hypothetical protein ACTFIY_008651 [Dictyostelium cf. discoideum]